MHSRGISQRELADVLTRETREQWTQSRVGKVLTGRVELQLNVLAVMAEAVGISLTEVVRDRGLEFYAELTPTEVRLLDWLRKRPNQARSLMQFADIIPFSESPSPGIGTKKRGTLAPAKDKARDEPKFT